jgi:hypothetical protein
MMAGLFSLAPRVQASPAPSPTAPSPTAPLRCPLDRATYRAVEKPAFELQFSPIANRQLASELVALTLQHPDRGMLATYHLGGGSGYGSYSLRDLAQPLSNTQEDAGPSLKPVFFDGMLRHVGNIAGSITQGGTITQGKAPKYLFIAGLGAEDWYANRAGNRSQPLGEVMWQLSDCRP